MPKRIAALCGACKSTQLKRLRTARFDVTPTNAGRAEEVAAPRRCMADARRGH